MSVLEVMRDPESVAAAILLIGAAASGIHLYATLGALGIASRLDLIPALPPGLSGLENGLVIATAGVLLLVEALADREPAFAGMWHTLHALVKPLAAALLSFSAIAGASAPALAGACALAAVTALLFHALRYGARIAHRMPDAPRGSFLLSLGEAALAVAFLVPLRFPTAAVPIAVGLVLVLLVGGPLGFRAFRLGVSAQRARLRFFLGESGWSGLERLPASLRRAVASPSLGGTPPRATRVGVLHAPGIGRFQRAWLVSDESGHRLLARTWRGRREVRVDDAGPPQLHAGAWADLLETAGPAEKLRILLFKDGPAPALVARSLAPEPVRGPRVDI